VGPLDGDGGGVAVALQVDTVAGHPEWVVDLQLVIGPLLWWGEHVFAEGIGNIRGKHLCLSDRKVIGGEVVDLKAKRGQTGAVEHRAGLEGVKVGGGGVAELGVFVGVDRFVVAGVRDDDDHALVVDHPTGGDGGQHAHQGQVEDKVGQFTS